MASLPVLAKAAGFTLAGPGVVALAIPVALAWYTTAPLGFGEVRPIGVALIVVGLALYVASTWRFVDRGNGTPSRRDEPEELVTTGVYAHVRNPMYVGGVAFVIGQGLLYDSAAVLGYGGMLYAVFQEFVRGYEEPHLREKYDEAYEQYCERVPRWIPRLRNGEEPTPTD